MKLTQNQIKVLCKIANSLITALVMFDIVYIIGRDSPSMVELPFFLKLMNFK